MNMQDSHDFVYMYVNISVLQFLFMSCKNNQQTKFIGWQVCMPRHITRTLCHICSQNGHVLKEEHLPGSSQEVTFILSYRTIAFDDSTIYSLFWYLGFFRPFTSSLAYSYSSPIHSVWERKPVHDFTGSEWFLAIMCSGFLCLLPYAQGYYNSLFGENGRSPCMAMVHENVMLKT